MPSNKFNSPYIETLAYHILVIIWSLGTCIYVRNPCYDTPFLFYVDLINTSIWIPIVMLNTLSFLTIFYVYQIPWRNTSDTSFLHDYYNYWLLMTMCTLGDIYGRHCGISFCDKSLLKEDLENHALKFLLQIEIDIYYDNYDDLEQDKRRYQTTHRNMHFHYQPELAILPRQKDQPSIDQNSNSSIRECVPYEGLELSNPRSVSSLKNGFPVKNIAEIDQNYICSSCKLILREPYRLNCGHRLCQLCINPQNTTINCLICSRISMNNEISFDKDFKDEVERLSIICTVCDWTGILKVYQEHFDQNHSDHFISCSLCFNQVERSKIYEHYLSVTHQQLLPNILLYLYSNKIKKGQLVFSQLNDTISSLSNGMMMVHNNLQQIDRDYRSYEASLQIITQDLLSLKMLSEDNDHYLSIMTSRQDILRENIYLIRECSEGGHIISFDGTLLWKISDIQQRLYDAKSERQRSIYSPEFYSSPFGYKMRSRLFLDGVNQTNRGYLSIYFILMRGDYDALLEWPFCFKVTFSLFDQSTFKNNRKNWSKFFWSNRESICFQRPRLEMNEGYGIENFISIEQFQQNLNRYVHDDTIFIQIEVDFLNRSSGNITSEIDYFYFLDLVLLSNSAGMLINDERHTDTNEDDILRRFFSYNGQVQ